VAVLAIPLAAAALEAAADAAAAALIALGAALGIGAAVHMASKDESDKKEGSKEGCPDSSETTPQNNPTGPAQPKSNPLTGEPGETSTTNHPDGTPKQVRKYGPDTYPETDVDYGHDHGQGDPHAHDWGRPSDGSPPTHVDRGVGRPVQPGDPTPN